MGRPSLKTILNIWFVVVPAVVLATLSIFSITYTALEWKVFLNQVTAVMTISEATDNIDQRVPNLAELSKTQLDDFFSIVQVISNRANKEFSGESNTQFHYQSYEIPPPGIVGSTYNGGWYSRYGTNIHRLNSSVLSDVIGPYLESVESFDSCYIGYGNGEFWSLPASDTTGLYNIDVSNCEATGSPTTVYDPQCRIWFHNALYGSGGGAGNTIVVGPYRDANSGELVMTLAQKLDTIGFDAVIGCDISPTASGFESNVVGREILPNGHAFIYNSDGDMLFGNDIDTEDVEDITEWNFRDSNEADDFASIFDDMKSLSTGSANYTKNDELWYISYTAISGYDWGVAFTAPFSDIDERVAGPQSVYDWALPTMIVLSLVVLIATILVFVFKIKSESAKITAPINAVKDRFKYIAQGNIDAAMGMSDSEFSDVQHLMDKSSNLVYLLSYANSSYDEKKYDETLDMLKKLLGIMLELKNDRGMAVIKNNIGITMTRIMKKTGNTVEEIIGNIQYAIDAASKEISTADHNIGEQKNTSGDIEAGSATSKEIDTAMTIDRLGKLKKYFTIALAERQDNMAQVLAKAGRNEEALALYDTAIDNHLHVENGLGYGITAGNKGTLYLRVGLPEKAFEQFAKVYNILLNQHQKYQTEKTAQALQYASMNLGIHYHRLEYGSLEERVVGYEKARQYLNKALQLTEKISKTVLINCNKILIGIYESDVYSHDPNALAEAQRLRQEYEIYEGTKKHFIMGIDVSFSMTGYQRIEKTRSAVVDHIIRHPKITDNDLITLVKFSDKAVTLANQLPKGPNQAYLEQQVMHNTEPDGNTYLYGMLSEQYDKIVASGMSIKNTYVIILTDGDNNRPSKYTIKQIIALYREKNIKVYVITAGAISSKSLSDIRKLVHDENNPSDPYHRHIDASKAGDIGNSFRNAMKSISLGQGNFQNF